MKHYGLDIAEGTEITNLTVPTGTSFPLNDNVGEFFYRTDSDTLYIRNNTTWTSLATGSGIGSVMEDLTPQLGGTLETNGNNITIATGDIITITDAPTSATDGANKSYVDSISAGLDPKASVRVATTAVLPAVTAAGSGVGKTLTANAVGIVTVDGQDLTAANSFAVLDRILIKNQASAIDNGIYTITTLSAAGVALVLTRALDFDGTPSNEVSGGNFTFAEEGTTNADTGWVVTANGDISLDTDAVDWTQYTGAGSFTAGLGLDQSGSTIFVKSSELVSATITTADTVSFFDNDGTTSATDAGDRKTTVANFLSDLSVVTSAAGSTNELQFNTSGSFDSSAELAFDGTSLIIGSTTTGNITSEATRGITIQPGDGNAQMNIFGANNGSGAAGGVLIRGGVGDSALGGNVTILGGSHTGTGDHSGSVITLTPGKPLNGGAAGFILISPQGSNGDASPVLFRDGAGINSIGLVAPATAGNDRTWVLPNDNPVTVAATGQFLTSDASGNLSFADVDGGTF